MAPSKSWTFNELDAYNIRIKTVDTKAFFGLTALPHPSVDPVILQNAEDPRDHGVALELSQDVRRFYIYLHDATKNDQTSLADDFTHHLLGDLLRFDKPRGITRIRLTLPFIMSGRRVNPKASVSVSREDYQIMLVQSDRVSVLLFPCCRASLLNTDKDISRPSGASASGQCSRRIFSGQRQAHCKWARSNVFQNVRWDCHDWVVGTLFLQDHHHTSPR
jgi:hypothetical protein